MGYREDVCVAYTKVGWELIVEKIPEMLNNQQIQDVVEFLNSVDDHSVNDDGQHCLFWSSIKTYSDDAQILFELIHKEIPVEEFYYLGLGEDGAEEFYGDWAENPFGIHTFHHLNTNTDSCKTWHDCHIVPTTPTNTSTSTQVIDDYTCQCGNTKCNKTEKSCWKCGRPISC